MKKPIVGEKVKVCSPYEDAYGTIVNVIEPCEYHSGRFHVLIHEKGYERTAEFWFSDYGESVIHVDK